MGRAGRVALLSTVVLLASCGFIRDRGGRNENSSGLLRDQSIDMADTARDYHIYVPDDPASASIVVLLHGNGGSADQLLGLDRTKAPYKVWLDIARRENLLLVVPDGLDGPNGKQGWNDCRTDAPTNPASDDVAFLGSLLDEVQATYDARSERAFVAGTSNGGLMTQRLADAMPERLDAVAIVAASRPVNTECDDSAVPLPVLFMNGTGDPISPYDGGPIASDRGTVTSTVDAVAYWVERNGVASIPVRTSVVDNDPGDGSTIVRLTYSRGPTGATVEHYEVVDGGHAEPSIEERYSRLFKRIVGEQNGDVEMAEEIWSFFDAQ